MDSLWGEEFKIDDSTIQTKKILKKIETPKSSVDVKKIVKSKSIAIQDKLPIIYDNVYRILGKYKDNTTTIKTKEQLIEYIDEAIQNGVIAIDTETNNSLDPISCKLMGPCIYTPNMKNAYIPINHTDFNGNRLPWQLTESDIKEQFSRLNDSNVLIIVHNGKFDYQVLKCTTGYIMPMYWDTLIGARLLNENEKAGLKYQYITKIDSSIEKYDIEHLFAGIEYAYVDPEVFALYAATDAFMTYKLYLYQKAKFEEKDNERLYKLFLNIEMPVVEVAANMELDGVELDADYAKRLSAKYHNMLDSVEEQIQVELHKYDDKISEWRLTSEANSKPKSKSKSGEGKSKSEQLETPVNITSPSQLAILLYDVLKIPVVDKDSPRGTGEDILKQMKLPLCDLILKERGILKLINTYIDALPQKVSPIDNRLHAQFNSIGTDTGRFSCISVGTKISSPSGDKNIEDIKPGDYVYCFDANTNKLKISRVVGSYYNGKRKCVKLYWKSKYNHSNTGELICTPDHMIRTTESWVEAQDIKPNDSILYVHRHDSKNSTSLYANFGQGNDEEHVWIKENYFNKRGKEYHIHHIDGNRHNNSPENLNVVTPTAHTASHLASKLPSNEHYCRRYNFSYDELIKMGEDVNWELSKLPYDFSTVLGWYRAYRINYILKYTESYAKRAYFDTGSKFHKSLHLPLNKSNAQYALDLSDGDIALAASYFAVNADEFRLVCDQYELLSNHNVYKIEYLDDLYDVYDLEIEGYHNFIANELCVHNCNSPNLQNIPSHEKSIRMLFKASTKYHTIPLYPMGYIVPETDEVLTPIGYKKVQDIVKDDVICGDDTSSVVTDIFYKDKCYYISVAENTSKTINTLTRYVLVGSDFSLQTVG